MEKLYAVRDAFFWWAGVWATVSMCNRAMRILTARPRQRDGRANDERDHEHEHEQYRREFARTMAELGREFLDGLAEDRANDKPETAETTNGDGAT